jgi:uncharacterized membrane protein YdjX (TVP38/TMEM64 family)
MNLVAGLSSISARRFLAASILGRLPGTVLLTLVGAYGLQVPIWLYGIAVLPLLLPAVIWLGRRRQNRMIVPAGIGDWPGGQ